MSTGMVKWINVIFLVCAAARGLLAQDFKQDVIELQKEFENMTSVHIVMDVKAYGNVKEARPYFQLHVDVKKQGNRYRYVYGDTEMLMNDNYLVMVNKTERQIAVTKRDVRSEAVIAKSMHFNLDSMISTIGTVEYKGEVSGVRQYTVPASKRVPETDLYIEVQTKSLFRIQYHYPEGQLVNIDFKTFDKQPVFADNTFNEANYVTVVKDKAIPVSAFKNFTVTK